METSNFFSRKDHGGYDEEDLNQELKRVNEKYRIEKVLDRLYEEIRHGDEEHQKWLKDKIEEFKKTL